tara:strand:+ start:496 stop:1020 length:525 start_codon:yes stop_codon:yes gene_type:complete
MIIDDDLLKQWEPKIQKMCSNLWIPGYDRDDLAQELRIAVIKSAKAYEENRGASFHTYLHSAMVNTIRTLLSKSNKQLSTKSLDVTYEETDLLPLDIVKALTDDSDFTLDFDITDEIFSCGLTQAEQKFLVLRLEGLTMEEITDDLGEPAYRIRQSLRKKILDGTNLYEKHSTV